MSKATDVWSLGILLYETLTAGETPYKECSKNKEVAEKVWCAVTGGWSAVALCVRAVAAQSDSSI